MAKKTGSAAATIEEVTPEAEAPVAEESQEATPVVETVVKEPKPVAEYTLNVRAKNAELRDSLKESQRANITHPDLVGVLGERFASKIVVHEDGDWIWMAACDYDGYPCYTDQEGRRWMSARYSYAKVNGEELPKGTIIRHTNGRNLSVNPQFFAVLTPVVKPPKAPKTETPAPVAETVPTEETVPTIEAEAQN